MAEVVIGIQARSGSKRLPGKSLALIQDVYMIEHVLTSAKHAAIYINNRKEVYDLNVTVCLLVPHHDPIIDALNGSTIIIEGPEDNVLERYRIAQQRFHPDYMVRITGDCPLMISTMITKHILSAAGKCLDYCSNSYPELRTFTDGYDCEVMSKRLMSWLFENANTHEDKEHVTILAKKEPPPWAKYGVILGYNDFSDIKLSVDTIDDLEAVRINKARMTEKLDLAKKRKLQVFRF